MKLGDLVIHRKRPELGNGLIVGESEWFDDKDYWWVLFEGNTMHEEWCAAKDIEVVCAA